MKTKDKKTYCAGCGKADPQMNREAKGYTVCCDRTTLNAVEYQAESRNRRICREAIGAEVRVALGGNEFLRGVIVECELADFGTAQVMLECGAARVRRGPFYLRQLPRGGAR